MAAADSPTAAWYRHFGQVDAPGSSDCYAEWALSIADDQELIARIDQWPHDKRQPILMLAAARFLGVGIIPYREFRKFLDSHWDEISRIVLTRATQTNEAGRCATLLPSLAAIEAAEGKPLALLEVGASAGLGLYPDRYGYEYDDGGRVTRLVPEAASPLEVSQNRATDHLPKPPDLLAPPVLRCTVTGPVPLPERLPQVAWRA